MEEDNQEKGFVTKDRRHFDESGSVRTEEEEQQEAQKPSSPAEPPQPKQQEPVPPIEEEPADAAPGNGPFPEITFANFIFSLSTTAMYHFGDIPDPNTKEPHKNLPAAKQTIDILTLLKTKTTGNLDEGEKELLDGVLFELRMRFVKEMKKQ